MIAVALLTVALGIVVSQDAAQKVTFSAGLTHDVTFLHAEHVVYDKMFVNVGNAYSQTTGYFTAPITGLYQFQYYLMAHQDKSAWLELHHNDMYVSSVYGHANGDYASAGNSVVLKLAKGDTVHIEAVDSQYGYNTTIYGQPNEIYTTFSGFLLAPVFTETPSVGK